MASGVVAKVPKLIILRNKIRVPAKYFSITLNQEVPCSSREVPYCFLFNENFKSERKAQLLNDMKVYDDYITTEEENSMFNELEPIMKRLRYERHHWDDAISGYRETEKLHWNAFNKEIINRVKKLAFSTGTDPLKYVHVLDLKSEGVIKPHVDSVKFCGNTIAGLSLLSDSVMRLRFNEEKKEYVDVLLKRRSLYVMTGTARYDYTHEILANEHSKFGSDLVIKTRRISVMCRNQP